MDVVTFGETMILMTPSKNGSLDNVPEFKRGMAGAESNAVIGLSRLGHEAAWISKLGSDSLGRFIYKTLRGEGVDVSKVRFDKTRPTAVFFKERNNDGKTHVYYYRRGSAASELHIEDIPLSSFPSAKYLFLTGITPALSLTNRKTVMKSIDIAHSQSMKVVFDPNIRQKLWSLEEARKVLNEVSGKSDIIIPGIDEGAILTGYKEPGDIAQAYLDKGAELVVVKLGAKGAYYRSPDEHGFVDGFNVQLVDEVGAGDAFTAGLLSGLLDGCDLPHAVSRACALGALAVTGYGDYEMLPYRNELESFMSGASKLQR